MTPAKPIAPASRLGPPPVFQNGLGTRISVRKNVKAEGTGLEPATPLLGHHISSVLRTEAQLRLM